VVVGIAATAIIAVRGGRVVGAVVTATAARAGRVGVGAGTEGASRNESAAATRRFLRHHALVPLDVHLKPLESLVFRSDIVAFGTFRWLGDASAVSRRRVR
jgi:hypothetical protein